MPEGRYWEIKRFLASSSIPAIDVTDIEEDRKPFIHDPHPGALWHEKVAQRLTQFIQQSNRD